MEAFVKTLGAYVELNGAKTLEEAGSWIKVSETNDFDSEICLYAFT